MKILKRLLLLTVAILLLALIINYPKLNILAGYSAKNTASSVFLGERSLSFTNTTDNNFSPVNLATNAIDKQKKTASSSVFGLLTRKSIIREGLGSVLTLDKKDEKSNYKTPKRRKTVNDTIPYPYGNGSHKDSVFESIDYKKLNETVNSIFGVRKTRAVLVLYKDQIIAEKYSEGFTKDSRILGWSMTKSIMSTVFGILEHQQKINIQDKAPVESWQNDARKEITIHNLLQMNSGLEWDENYDEISDATKMLFLERDMTKVQEEKPLIGKPNETWNAYLIDKIGMNSMILESDLAGNYVASSYAWATTRDWGKFGLLYLHNGAWNGEELFTKEWVDYVTTPTPTSNGSYGAQFWLNTEKQLKDVSQKMYFADGYQGQRVYILPDEDLVIVRFGLSWFEENEFLKGIIQSIQ